MRRAMRRSTETIIAVQFLTLLVAVTGLLLAQDSHRGFTVAPQTPPKGHENSGVQ